MLRMGPVLARVNDHGVSGAEPECTARYQDILYARTEVGYRRSRKNRPRAYAYLAGINMRSMGASMPHGVLGSRQVIPEEYRHA